MKKAQFKSKNLIITLLILTLSFFMSVGLQYAGIEEHITTLFVFAVFLVSLNTEGYWYGIFSAISGTLMVNYAFTFPYFSLNFTIGANLLSAVIMIALALMTSTLISQNKRQQLIKAESEKERMRANLLRAVSHDLRTPLTSIYGSSSVLIESSDTMSTDQKDKMLKGIKEDSQWLIQMVENLPDLDTTGSLVDPTDTMELRKDEVQPSFPRAEMLQNAPYTAAGCILIPKVVD
jgi:two-component system sensor histidine kinase KdpD